MKMLTNTSMKYNLPWSESTNPGNFRPRKLKLKPHHKRIVQAVHNDERRDNLAIELEVDRKTIYHYIKDYVDTEGIKTATSDNISQFYVFKGKILKAK